MPTRVLVVEDDAAIASGLVRGLRAAGFDVELAVTGESGAKVAMRDSPDVIVLDLMLPDGSGFEVLERLSGRTTAKILVLTARTELSDRLRAFELGAVDFVAKPFFVAELVARIRSRVGERRAEEKRLVRWADVELDLDARRVTVSGAEIAITRHELDVLAYLVGRPGRAIARGQLADSALDPGSERDARTVDSHVARLRKKLGRGGSAIVTVWGIGYRFDPEKAP
jgi:DNA-binding response OmpR family regulator